MKSGGSRKKKTRHLPTRKRSSPGRSLRDFTSPCPVAAKRTRAASIRAWTTRSSRARSRSAAGRKTTRRITAQAGVELLPGEYRRQVRCAPDPAWPRSLHQRFPAHPVRPERKWPPAPQCPEGHPRAIEGGCDRRTYFDYSFARERLPPETLGAPRRVRMRARNPRGSTTVAVDSDGSGVYQEESGCRIGVLFVESGVRRRTFSCWRGES